MTDIDASLANAVEKALEPAIAPLVEEYAYLSSRSDAVQVCARAICAVSGPRTCWCAGNARHCHADKLWGDYAIAAVLGLEKAGYKITKTGK